MTRIRLTTEIEAPLEICFDLCLNVDIQRSLSSGMRAVAGVRSGPLHLGDTVTWQAWHFGVPWRMTSRITEVNLPHCFGDEMLRGPFARWHHVHTFQRTAEGSRLTDDVEYATPLGVLGALFDAVVLERYLRRLLASRNRRFKRTVETVYRAQRRGT